MAQTTIWTEDFSTSSNYTVTLGGEGSNGDDNYFFRTDGSNINVSYTGNNGYFFAAQDIDDGGWAGSAAPSELTWSNIDISGYDNLSFSGLFASAATNKIDASDYVYVEYRIDGGNWTKLIEFENDGTTYNTYFLEDTDFDGTGDGTQLTSTFQNFTKSISGTGSNLDIRIRVSVNSGGEDFAFDEFKIEGDAVSCTAPTTQAYDISFSDVTESSFTISWTSGNGSNRIVKINTSNSFTDPADGTEYTANSTYSGSGEQVVYNGNGNSVTVDGLSPGTTYWIRIYEYNCSGSNTVYNTSTASNNPNSQTTLTCDEPTSPSTDLTFNNVSTNSITVSWTEGNGTYHLVVVREGTAVTSTPVDGTTYTADNTFGNGSDIGSGEYVVYAGDNNSVTVYGLQDSTRYYFRIFEFNCSGGNEDYLVSSYAEGDTITQNIPDPAILERGDIAVVGLCSNISTCVSGTNPGDDEISFVCFKDITPGTVIDLTDNGWQRENADEWGNTEGYYRIKRTGNTITAGTVITIRLHNSSPYVEGVFPDNDWSLDIQTGSLIMNSNGDQIFFMQNGTWNNGTTGNHDATYDGTILFGFNTNDSWLDFGQSTQESGLPYQMECFSMLPNTASDYLKYTGPMSPASQMEWIGRINDNNNWTAYSGCADYYSATPDYTNGDTLQITTTYMYSEFKWFGTRDSSWFNCGNWSTLRVPEYDNDVEIPNTSQVQNNIYIEAGETAECKNLVLNHPDYKIIAEGSSDRVLKINGTLTINAGTLDFDDGNQSTQDGIIYLKGDWINNDTVTSFLPGNSIVYFNGATTQNISGTSKINNFHTLNISSGTTLNSEGRNIIMYGDWIDNGSFTEDTSTVFFEGTAPQTINAVSPETFHKLNFANDTIVTLNTDIAADDTLFLDSGIVALNGHTLTINKQMMRIKGMFSGTTSSNISINISGSLYDSLYFISSGRMLSNLDITANGIVVLGTDLASYGQLSLSSGAILVLNGNHLTLNGTVSGTGLLRGDNNATLTIGGSGSLGTLYFETSNNEVDTLTINRTSGSATLGTDLNVLSLLDLTNGIIYTGTNKLIVQNDNPTSIANYNTGSYVDGNLRRYVQSTGDYVFPVGDGNYEIADLNLNSSSGISYFDAKFTHPTSFNTDISSLGLVLNGTPVTTLLDYGYWTITPDNFTTVNYDITLTSRGHTNGGTTADQHTIVKRHDSTTDWNVYPANHNNNTQSGTGTNPITAKLSGLADFSDFAIARSDEFALPVDLLSFSARLKNGTVLLEWETTAEINNDFFTVEKSYDGENYFVLATVHGAGNSNLIHYYNLVDKNPAKGINYYKLYQTDFDGLTKEKGKVTIEINNLQQGISYLVEGNNLIVNNSQGEEGQLFIVDLSGKTLITSINLFAGINKIGLDRLSHGQVYLLKIITPDNTLVDKFFYK